jgi:hypothetical protein
MLSDINPRRRAPCVAALALAASMLAACSGMNEIGLQPRPSIVAVPAPPPAPEPQREPSPAERMGEAIAPVLTYADHVRTLQGAELAQEITRFTDLTAPDEQLKLALALMQTRQLYDLVRAQELVQRVLTNTGDAARQLHPLARLFATRFSEQRRVEDQLDRQGAQLRDAQRRLEQTNDKLEALKEIERSLTIRPAATPVAPTQAPAPRPRPKSSAP